MNTNNPVFDQKLWQDCELKATGQNVHGLKNRMATYKNEFDLVERFGKSWDDIVMPISKQTRRDVVKRIEKDLRWLLTVKTVNTPLP